MTYERPLATFSTDGALPLRELDRVALASDQATRGGETVPAGSAGTIVAVLGEGQAYMVEFARPFHALVTVMAREVRPATELGA